MVSTKYFNGLDGTTRNFLSEFIIKSEHYVRVYNYVFDPDGVDGDVDATTGLYIRTINSPNVLDTVPVGKWLLVDNIISFYTAPLAGTTVVLEIATNTEELGDILAGTAADRAEIAQGLSEAARDASIAAQVAAETARDEAVVAQGLSEDARDLAEQYRDEAVVAKTASETAQGLSEDARDASIVSQTAAETAATTAQTAATVASAATDTAITKAVEASESATQASNYAYNANTSATTATTQASIATTQATIATTQATIATTKANEAAASALEAAGYVVPEQTGNEGKFLSTDGTTTTWETIAQPTAPIPTVSIVSSLNESTTAEGIITNYSSDYTYFISVDVGSVLNNNDGTFVYTAPSVDVDTVVTISIYSKFGFFLSETADTNITVVNVPIEADDAYVDNLATDDSEYNDGWEIV